MVCGHPRLDRRVVDQHAAPFLAPQEALDASQQDVQIKWLGKIVVRAGRETLEDVFGTTTRCEHEEWNEVIGLAQLGRNSEAIFAGKHHVKYEQIKWNMLLEHEIERSLAVARDAGGVALGFEIKLQTPRKVFFVFHQQDLRRHC